MAQNFLSDTIHGDGVGLMLGTGGDAFFKHDGSNFNFFNDTGIVSFYQRVDDGQIKFYNDDGSGGTEVYLTIDGNNQFIRFDKPARFNDGDKLQLGIGSDFNLFHDGTNSYIQNYAPFYIQQHSGVFSIEQHTDDGDIIFKSDDGNGGTATYFSLDGGEATYESGATSALYTIFPDKSRLTLGTGKDLQLYHNATDSIVQNLTGDLYFINHEADKDIVFQNDDGSGGVATYFYLDGSGTRTIFEKLTRHVDDVYAAFGTDSDLRIYHDGSNSYIKQVTSGTGDLIIEQDVADKDIIFKCDDGSGGTETYFFLDGSANGTTPLTTFPDHSNLGFGSGPDTYLYHNGTDFYLSEYTGHLKITNYADDKDIIFSSDDGAGGTTAYFTVDGSLATHNGSFTTAVYTLWGDRSHIAIGGAKDMQLYHDGSNSYIEQIDGAAGDLIIQQGVDDKDIIFKCDDGSGGTTAYITLDGSVGYTVASKNIRFDDSIAAAFGTGTDAFFNHNGSGFYFFNDTGDVTFTNRTDDGDIIFASDNGSGGTATYLTLDGSAVETVFSKATRHSDSVSAYFGAGNDLELQHDGGDSYITIRNHDLKIQQTGDDKSIIFYSDDGSGGVAEYFRVDGANSSGSSKFTSWPDNSKVSVGTGLDAQFYHSGSHTYIENNTGALNIIQNTNDGNIVFTSDDGAGGTFDYFSVDGGSTTHDGSATTAAYTKWPDKSRIALGTGKDLQLYHDGSNSYIADTGTGILYIQADSQIRLDSPTSGEKYARFYQNGQVELFYDNTIHFETTSAGVKITGIPTIETATASGTALYIHNTTDSVANTKTLIDFRAQASDNSTFYVSGQMGSKAEGTWTSTSSTRDASLIFNTVLNGNNELALTLASDKSATFAGNIIVSGSTNRSIILDYTSGSGTYTWASFKQSGTEQFRIFGDYTSNYLSFYNDQASVHQLKLNSDGSTTFAGNVTATYFGRDAHNRIDFQTDDVIHYRVGDSYWFRMDTVGFRPYTDSSMDLGGSSYYWKDAYIDTITTTGNIRIGGTAITPNTNFDNLVIEGTSHTGISIISGSTGTDSDGGIYFGDQAANNLGQIKYLHASNSMTFATNDGSASLTLDSGTDATFAGDVTISGGHLGLSGFPRTDLHATWNQMFIGSKGSLISENGGGGIPGMTISDNLYIDSDTGTYACLTTDQSSQLTQEAGTLTFKNAASASAGAAPTLTERFSINASGNATLTGDTTIRRNGSQTAGELLIGGTTDGGFVDFDGTSLQLNTQRDPNTGTFVNTSKSHASIIMSGANADSSIKFYTTTSNNTTGTLRWTIDKNGALIKNGGTSSQYLMADGSVATSTFNGGTVTGDITIDKDAARLILQDDSTGNALNQWISYRDNDGTERAYVGYGSTSNSVFYVVNNLSDLKFYAGGVENSTMSGANTTFAGNVNAGTGLRMYTDGSGNGVIYNLGQDKDLYLVGDDGGSGINALVFDMSEGGAATFAGNVSVNVAGQKAVLHVKNEANNWEDGVLLEHDSGDTGWNIHPENNSDNALWFGYNSDTSVALTSQGATAALKLNSDLSATFGGDVATGGEFQLNSSAQIDWGNGDARIVEGNTNNYSLSFQTYDGSACSTALRLEGNNNAYLVGKLGIGTADPDGDGYSYAEDLVIKGGNSASDGAGITIAGNGKTYGVIAFGDAADNNIGEIYYSHSDNSMNLRTNTNVALNLDSSGNAKIKGAVIVNNSSTISTTTTTGEYLTHQQNSHTMRLLGLSNSWCHILTTANYFYFDKGLRVDTGEIGTYNEDMQLNRAGTNFARGFANGIFQPHYLGGYDGVEGGSTGRRFITKGSGDNSIYFGCYDDNGYGYLENYNNSSGMYFNTAAGHFRFDTGSVIPYNDSEIYLGLDANRWICVYADGFNTSGQIDWTNGFSIKQGGSNYGRIDNWIDLQSTGLYSTTLNGAHIYPNNYSSYGSMALSGTRNGYYGMLFANIANKPHFMFDASGNGGEYHEGNATWASYWHVSNACMGIGNSTTSSSYTIYSNGAIYSTGDVVAYSDRRAKENIVTVDNALDKVSKLRGVYYNKKDSDEKKREVGVIAQEVKEVLPEVVTYAKDVDEYGVDYGKINGLLIEAIKDLKKEIEELKQCKKCTDCDCNN